MGVGQGRGEGDICVVSGSHRALGIGKVSPPSRKVPPVLPLPRSWKSGAIIRALRKRCSPPPSMCAAREVAIVLPGISFVHKLFVAAKKRCARVRIARSLSMGAVPCALGSHSPPPGFVSRNADASGLGGRCAGWDVQALDLQEPR